MKVAVVAGNPKPQSRTLAAGILLAEKLAGRPAGTGVEHTIDVIELGSGLLGWGDEAVNNAVREIQEADLAVFASPTFKATYTGLLKLFLDQFEGSTGLQNVVSVPLMLGAGPAHALAPDVTLKPVLAELGGTCALPGLYLRDKSFAEDAALDTYVQRWTPIVNALVKIRSTGQR
ncbi:NADPH-dependent FMN reductase [Rhodococcus sp. NPDC057014]|uniref:NADPH-dependent FMN reductase n=1 Tax=Rhodococcus sp. NPDC057014 TaxID=3346000 RepID=UPI00363C2832